MTTPERIWAVHWGTYGAVANGAWADTVRHFGGGVEYILHTRAALAASPLVQEIVAEAVLAGLGVTKPLAAELLQWIDDELERWPKDTAYADDLARFAAAIRARGEG